MSYHPAEIAEIPSLEFALVPKGKERKERIQRKEKTHNKARSKKRKKKRQQCFFPFLFAVFLLVTTCE